MSSSKGIMRFGKKNKLCLCYISLFEVLERIEAFPTHVALPLALLGIHNVFHVPMLKKEEPDPSHVIDCEPIDLRRI